MTNSKDGKTSTTTMTPNKQGASIDIFENSEYWIDAKIRSNKNTSSAYNTIEISTLDEKSQRFDLIELPEKQILIISGIVIAVGIVGILKRK